MIGSYRIVISEYIIKCKQFYKRFGSQFHKLNNLRMFAYVCGAVFGRLFTFF